ncbi:MAG: IscS subfamily cysteine desulfurase [Planctomycetota bacterium]|nr:MAG: IscS subfamily cysteine desulfurase [Planctomycetota bacterium]
MPHIYLDNNATTPLDSRVLDAMMPYLTERYGNAASRSHAFGWDAEAAVKHARKQVAKLIGADPKEILFTSGATESDNLALKGAVEMLSKKGRHIITATTEHKAILDTAKYLESTGKADVTWLEVDANGLLTAEQVKAAMREDTILVSIMMANNEIGVIQPIAEIGAVCREAGVWFHTDATQAVGKIPFDVNELNVDIVSFSAHKIYGPKGVGGLYVRRRNPRVRLTPQMHGGGHERGMRSGTLNVPGIVGLGAACELAGQDMSKDAERCRRLRDRLESRLRGELDHVALNGDEQHRLPSTFNISFAYVEGESLIMGMPEVAVSSGSACTSASLEPSYVLRALGVGDDLCHSSIRFSVGRFSTEEEVDRAAETIIATVRRLRDMSPLYEMALEGIDPNSVDWKSH